MSHMLRRGFTAQKGRLQFFVMRARLVPSRGRVGMGVLRSKSLGRLTIGHIAVDGGRRWFAVWVSQKRDGLVGGNGGLIVPRSDVWSGAELGLEMTSLALYRRGRVAVAVAVRMSLRVRSVLRSSEIQAGREWDD